MAPLPPFIARLVSVYLTQALTRKLQQSPAFFRLVDRLVHEADHLPNRLQGRAVPPYIGRDPHEPTLSEQARDAWQRQVDDPGEPHDMPDPFGKHSSSSESQQPDSSRSSSSYDPLLQRQRAQKSMQDAQLHAQRTREKQRREQHRQEQDKGMDEMRALLERLREGKEGQGGGGDRK